MTIQDFEKLYKDNFNKIFNFFFYSLMNREEAEELTSTTFFKFYSKMDYYDSTKALPVTYLWGIAHNVLKEYYRTSCENLDIDKVKDELKIEENFDDRLLLIELLAALSKKERQILYYKYYMDMTAKEISEITGLSVTNITSICSRALGKARKVYEKNLK